MNASGSQRKSGIWGAVLVFAVLAPAGLVGQTTARTALEAFEPHPEADKAISVLKSPFCPGLMLEVCTSPYAAMLRDTVHTMAYEGWASDSLVAWVMDNYGDTLLALPPVSGRGLVAWIVPPGAILLGMGIVALFLRAVMARQVLVEGTSEDLSDDEEAALRDALRELDAGEEPIF